MSTVLIIGKPNSGKSLLFTKITGVFQKVSNFPGVTVEVKKARKQGITYMDFPGIYSLNPLTKDEDVAVQRFREALKEEETKMVLCVLDVTRIERSLSLAIQIKQIASAHDKKVVFALNMMDEIQKRKLQINIDLLSKKLFSPVIAVSARKNKGLEELQKTLHEELSQIQSQKPEDAFYSLEPQSSSRQWTKDLGLDSGIFVKSQNQIDRFLLSGAFGGILFFLIMLLVFQSIFTWATPLMDFTEEIIIAMGEFTSAFFPEGIAKDFVNDAIFGGFGSFLVFAPQIFILSLIIGILEDSGYLARAAIICHKPFSYFGLTGKSFVPILSGHACAIPAIFATRTIESPKRRLLTLLAVPLTACSARLPVYTLLISAIIPAKAIFGGLIGLQGLCFFLLYLFGILMALVVAAVLSRSIYKEESDSPFVLELPSYRLPHWKPLLQRSLNSAWSFVRNAGPMIFMVTVVVWILGYFPEGPEHLNTSWLSYLGKWVEPVFSPLGIDWKFGVAILTSFLAREVFVGTLGTMLGIEAADENIGDLATKLQADGLSLATGVALLVFYAIALQCVSTLAVIKKETGKLSYSVGVFFAYGALAYLLSLLVYRLLA